MGTGIQHNLKYSLENGRFEWLRSFAQVGKCLIELIGGSESLPYVDDERYNLRRKKIRKGLAQTITMAGILNSDQVDVLHRKLLMLAFLFWRCLIRNASELCLLILCTRSRTCAYIWFVFWTHQCLWIKAISTTRTGTSTSGVSCRTRRTSRLSSGTRLECDSGYSLKRTYTTYANPVISNLMANLYTK